MLKYFRTLSSVQKLKSQNIFYILYSTWKYFALCPSVQKNFKTKFSYVKISNSKVFQTTVCVSYVCYVYLVYQGVVPCVYFYFAQMETSKVDKTLAYPFLSYQLTAEL